MINPFDLRWVWKAIRGHSLTFAVVFVAAVCGLPLFRFLRSIFEGLALPWLLVWILPLVVITVVARLERRWLPDEKKRRGYALALVLLGLVVAFVLPRLRPADPDPPPPPAHESPLEHTAPNETETAEDDQPPVRRRPIGPPGRR
ncbi:MAG: hypothetical protein EA425_13410 [Puniceicoccaceae bacterium]|nr:MAG: hypothetical protein EA425_13410 [Puniceicoccaceae bacterium]